MQGVPLYHLHALRTWRGLSQVQLAHRAGLALSSLARIEEGRAQPTPATRARLAQVLEVAEAVLHTPDRLTALAVAAVCDRRRSRRVARAQRIRWRLLTIPDRAQLAQRLATKEAYARQSL